MGAKAFTHYLGEEAEKWQEWDSCALMLASDSVNAIPMLIDQGDADQFLAGQLQPAVLAEAARQKDWPLTLRIQPGYDHSYYFMASFVRIISASMRSICSDKFRLLPGSASCLPGLPLPSLHTSIRLNPA